MRTRKVLVLLGLIAGLIAGLATGFRVERTYPQNGYQFGLVVTDNERLVAETQYGSIVLEDGSYSVHFDVGNDDSEALVIGNWYGLPLARVIHLHKSRLEQ